MLTFSRLRRAIASTNRPVVLASTPYLGTTASSNPQAGKTAPFRIVPARWNFQKNRSKNPIHAVDGEYKPTRTTILGTFSSSSSPRSLLLFPVSSAYHSIHLFVPAISRDDDGALGYMGQQKERWTEREMQAPHSLPPPPSSPAYLNPKRKQQGQTFSCSFSPRCFSLCPRKRLSLRPLTVAVTHTASLTLLV